MALFCLTANSQSISDAIRKFDTAMLNAQVSKGETVITSINYSDTNSCGSIVGWIKNEIKLAASQPQIPRLTIVQSSDILQEEQTAVIATTRGVPLKTRKMLQKKFVISGTYQQVEDNVEVFLFLKTSDGADFSSAKVIISMNEVNKRKLTLYPQNVEQAKEIYSDIEDSKKTMAKRNPENSIPIVATLLDSENNIADIIYPDSKVHFLIGSPEKDAYIAILNISAEGKKFWLKFDKKGTNKKFIPAGETWRSPNFRPADNVYGMETIYIYAASSPEGLPNADSERQYRPKTITTITRELMLDLSDDEIETGTFALSYTVLPSPAE